jgi:phosphoserine phosphatase
LAERFPHYDSGIMEPSTVCGLIDMLNADMLAFEGLKPAAVFDLDDTVWEGQIIDPLLAALIELEAIPDTSNPALIRSLVQVGIEQDALRDNSVSDNAKIVLERTLASDLPKAARISRKEQFSLVAEMMAGLAPSEARGVVETVFENGSKQYGPWKDQFFASEDGCGMREIIAKLKAKGVEVYLLSASLQPIVDVAGNLLGVDSAHRRGSPMEVEGGVYTGRVESLYTVKAPVMRAWIGGPALLAFGDSVHSDYGFMADVAGPVFMVNPDAAFLAKDAEHAGGRFVALHFSDNVGSLAAKSADRALNLKSSPGERSREAASESGRERSDSGGG